MDKQIFHAVETPIGFLGGRDAIYLDELHRDFHTRDVTLTLKGSFNGKLSSSRVDEWIHYVLTFSGVIAFKCLPLEWWEQQGFAIRGASSFDEVENSPWLAEMEPERETHFNKHYIIQAYDEVVEVLAYEFDCLIAGHEPFTSKGG